VAGPTPSGSRPSPDRWSAVSAGSLASAAVAHGSRSLAVPPDELIDRVVSGFSNESAQDQRALFLETGRRSLEDLERALAVIGDSLEGHERILEFGCGCGRIMRWMEELGDTRTLVGTDIDERAIGWAAKELPFARFDVNEGLPPTRYADGEFDLIINHSVFTHLDEHYQDRWLEELQRIAAPGGVLVLSTRGEHAFSRAEQQLAPTDPNRRRWREILERDGIFFTNEDAFVGSAFPDFYHTAFHAPWYVFEHWSKWFEVLAFLPRSSLEFQDQVVLRRPTEGYVSTPIRARRSSGDAPPEPAAAPSGAVRGAAARIIEPSGEPSHFGSGGLLARRLLFRAARPILHAQLRVDRALDERIAAVEGRLEQRMPPLVHTVLHQQAERIQRLDRELEQVREGRSSPGEDPADRRS